MTTPIDARDAAIKAIKTALPHLRECEAHPGRFNLDELKRFLTKAPSVRVACLGIGRFEREASGMIDCDVQFAAFVLTDGSVRLPGGAAAVNIITALVPLIDRNDWGLENVGAAVVTRAENLYGGDLDNKGVALWALTWTQTVRLGIDIFGAMDLASGGVAPRHVYASMNPGVGASNRADYRDVRTGETPDV